MCVGILSKAAEYDSVNADSLLSSEDFVVDIGSGIKCKINGHEVVIGNRRSLESHSIEITNGTYEAMEYLEDQGQTAVVCSIGGQSEAIFGLRDNARDESKLVVQRLLADMGIKAFMLTGDNHRTAQVVAADIGIPPEHVIADVLPEGKVDCIKKLQERGEIVAMVGDGVNDSPAMAQAEVGIAIGAGTDVAIETAGIVLVNSNLTDVLAAIDLSRTVFNRIKLNFVWALGYNTLTIPVAAGALYPFMHVILPPYMAAVAMIMSSLSVLTSSLLLNLYKVKDYTSEYEIESAARQIEVYNSAEVSEMSSSLIYPGCGMMWGKGCTCTPETCKCGISCSTETEKTKLTTRSPNDGGNNLIKSSYQATNM